MHCKNWSFRCVQAKFASKALHSNIEVFMELGQDVGQAMRGAFLKTHRDFVQVSRERVVCFSEQAP